MMQACILLCWYFYQEGRWVEVWIFAGFLSRVAIPLRLNYPGTFSALGGNSPGAYLAPPKDFVDLESRRRTWWMTIMFDRIVSVGGWLHGVDERDIGTEFPLRCVDFESSVSHSVSFCYCPRLIPDSGSPTSRVTPRISHHPICSSDTLLLTRIPSFFS